MACTVFGLKTSAVSLLHTIWEIPNQSANRMIVPKLPGSWIPSNGENKLLFRRYFRYIPIGAFKDREYILGIFRKLALRISSSSATNNSLAGISPCVAIQDGLAINNSHSKAGNISATNYFLRLQKHYFHSGISLIPENGCI